MGLMMQRKKPVTQKTLKNNASKLHAKVYGFCKNRFPLFTVYQEYPIDCDDRGRNSHLFIDIFIKELNLAIECHGKQHFEESAFFYGSSFEFKQAQKRDELKKIWCKNNEITLVIFKYNDKLTVDFFNKTIDNAIRSDYERRKRNGSS